MAKKGRPRLTPSIIEEIKDRIRLTGLVESVYEQEPKIVTKATYSKWYEDHRELSTEVDAALGDYRRSQPGYFIHLARACIEDYLTSHRTPRITTSRTKKTRYVPKYDQAQKRSELVLDYVEESETTNEVILRCPPKIIEMIMPQIPRTTIEVLATQMANEGVMPQGKAQTIMAIADKAQTNIREVLSGGLSETEE
jgi:hypothetical protein